MKTKEELKKMVCDAIDARRDEIIAFADSVAAEPELGFKEVKTSEKFASILKTLGREPRTGVAGTGVVDAYQGKQSGIRVAVMGELDAILVADHPDADKVTGAVHACGHNAQLASIAAIAFALHDTDLMENLDGDIVLMGVPAEEFVEITYRNKRREEGKQWFLGGKQEFIRLGEFDDIDISVMQHSSVMEPGFKAGASSVCTGFTTKLVNYKGKAAHAGAAPFEGVNALNAAMLGLMAVAAISSMLFRRMSGLRLMCAAAASRPSWEHRRRSTEPSAPVRMRSVRNVRSLNSRVIFQSFSAMNSTTSCTTN